MSRPSVERVAKRKLEILDDFNARTNQTPAKPGTKNNASASPSSAVKSTPASGKKRKAELSLDEEIAAYKQNLDDVVDPDSFEDDRLPSCSVIRGKINRLIDSGIMTKTDFCNAIGANSNSLNIFLRKRGTYQGSGSSVWRNAYSWFKQREVLKIKMPDMKKRQLEKQKPDAAASSCTARASASKILPSSSELSSIKLPREEDDDAPVYETCDDVRRKINAHLKTPGLSQAQFCRDIYAQLHAPKCKQIQSKQLTDFRGMKGPYAGAKSTVYYAAYVYFEKLRLAQGKSKTKHRQEMEGIHPGGLRRDVDHRTQ
ncbi:hypothetical protein F66182_10752 [Fusarium sp. NRRL 66182]|nr:hypothetical protein F66182_10752 [Fusarium sp. NRRL 66182]